MKEPSNRVVLLLEVDIGDMTAAAFERARKEIRGYANATLQCEGGKLVGDSVPPKWLPKAKSK